MSQICSRCGGSMVYGTGSRGPGAIDAPRPNWGCPNCAARANGDAFQASLRRDRRKARLAALSKVVFITVLLTPGLYGHQHVVWAYLVAAGTMLMTFGMAFFLARLGNQRWRLALAAYEIGRKEALVDSRQRQKCEELDAKQDRFRKFAWWWRDFLAPWRWFVVPPVGGLGLAIASYLWPVVTLALTVAIAIAVASVAVRKQKAQFVWCGKCGASMSHSSGNKYWCGHCRYHRDR